MDYALCIIGDVETGGMEPAAVSKKSAEFCSALCDLRPVSFHLPS